MTKWTCVHSDKGGHRLFSKVGTSATDRDRLWVADASGSTPDKTDDGALEICPDTKSVVLHASHGYLVAGVTVLKAPGKTFSVFLSCGCALYLARTWGLPVVLQDPTLPNPVACVVVVT